MPSSTSRLDALTTGPVHCGSVHSSNPPGHRDGAAALEVTPGVALVGDTNAGWLVEAESAGEALDVVHGTVPRAHESCKSELLVWNESYYRDHYLAGGPFPDSWTRLSPPAPCPACAKGCLVDPGGTDAGTRCMVEVDAGADGLVLEAGCGYRPTTGGGHRLD